MIFKGFDDWVEIFKGGKQIDSAGVEHDGDALIKKAVVTFDSSHHEPPAVIGHPRADAPAWAWVEELLEQEKGGENYLFAKFKQVVPEFKLMAENGMFKKRSASFYPDGRLRHVGFLGAAPPAVKGLKDIAFKDDNEIVFEFGDKFKPGDHREKKEGKMSVFGEKFKSFMSAMGVDVSKVPDDALPVDIPPSMKEKVFSEADIEAAKKEAAEKVRKEKDAEFAEQGKKDAKQKASAEVVSFIESGIKDGKLLPRWKDMGIQQFMEDLDVHESIRFSEGGDEKTRLRWFMDFLADFAELPIFKEIARKDSAAQTKEFAEAKADADMGKSIASKVNPKGKEGE